MDDFGNIIYVLGAIGWFVWNTYRKAQEGKKKPAGASRSRRNTSDSEGEKPFKSLEDLIMGQFGDAEKEEELKPVTVASRNSNEDKFLKNDLTHSHLSDDYVMSSGEMQSHRVVRQVRKLDVIQDSEIGLMDELFPEGFDLKQAVVSNAILERPYR